MENILIEYKRLCRQHDAEKQECVLLALNRLLNCHLKPVLDLSTCSLTSKTCLVLGMILAGDHSVKEVRLNDCLLSEQGVQKLVHGLRTNSQCKRLELKGNNVRGAGVEELGKLLRDNSALTHLYLEWNSLGTIDTSFACFCSGLSANRCLVHLDMRNNQISHDGAKELASSLKNNSTLQTLDLRWNSVGLLGGRALLDLLQTNKSLVKFDLSGNNVPRDILTSIEMCVERNADRRLLMNDHAQKTKTLSNHVRQLEQNNCIEMNNLMNDIDVKDDLLRTSERCAGDKIGQLQLALEDRKNSFNALAAKLALTESELTLSQQKCGDLQTVISTVKKELSEKSTAHRTEMCQNKQEWAVTEANLLKQLSEASDTNNHLNTQICDLERKCKQQQDCAHELREQLSHTQAENKIKASQMDERLVAVKQQCKAELRENEQAKQNEINRLRLENEESCNLLRDKVKKLEGDKLELEGDITRMKASAVSERVQNDEQINLMKHRIKTEEEQKNKYLQDKVCTLQSSREEMDMHNAKQCANISELLTKNNHYLIEIESLKRRLELVQQELAVKSTEVAAEVTKVRQEFNQQSAKLDGAQQIHTELRDKLSQADKQLSDQMISHRQTIEEKEREIICVQEKLKSRELQLAQIKEEENQRVTLLHSAITNYCSNRSYVFPSNN